MNDALFAELIESVREGGAILRGEREASRRFEVDPIDVKGIQVTAQHPDAVWDVVQPRLQHESGN